MKSISRIALAAAALQLLAALAGHDARAGAFDSAHAAGVGSSAVVKTAAPPSQATGRRGRRRRAPDSLLPGVWGGKHISFEVTEGGATVEFDCAQATVEGRIVVDRAGRFSVAGTYVQEHGGPVRSDESSGGVPVRLSGRVGGSLMTLTITRGGTRESVGTFTLARDRVPRIVKCR